MPIHIDLENSRPIYIPTKELRQSCNLFLDKDYTYIVRNEDLENGKIFNSRYSDEVFELRDKPIVVRFKKGEFAWFSGAEKINHEVIGYNDPLTNITYWTPSIERSFPNEGSTPLDKFTTAIDNSKLFANISKELAELIDAGLVNIAYSDVDVNYSNTTPHLFKNYTSVQPYSKNAKYLAYVKYTGKTPVMRSIPEAVDLVTNDDGSIEWVCVECTGSSFSIHLFNQEVNELELVKRLSGHLKTKVVEINPNDVINDLNTSEKDKIFSSEEFFDKYLNTDCSEDTLVIYTTLGKILHVNFKQHVSRNYNFNIIAGCLKEIKDNPDFKDKINDSVNEYVVNLISNSLEDYDF